MISSLTIRDGDPPGEVFVLDRDEMVIGKQAGCDIVLPDKYVSKSHARIVRRSDGQYIENLNNTNKTKVGGELLTTPRRLADGDVITICNYTLVFALDDARSRMTTKILETINLSAASCRSLPRGGTDEKLRAIMEISAELVGILDLNAVLEKVLDVLFRTFPQAERGFILSREDGASDLTTRASKLKNAAAGQLIPSRTVYDVVAGEGQAILFENVPDDSRIARSDSIGASRAQSIMCAPLRDHARKPVGVLQLDTRDHRNHFKQDDLDFLVTVAGTISMAVENARLHEIEVRHQQSQQESRDAWAVQRSFLPERCPAVPRFEFWHYYKPARDVGGDYFDYLPLRASRSRSPAQPTNQWAIALGDVSGKGMPAALLMARISTEVRLLLQVDPEPTHVARLLNQSLYENGAGRFVTFLLTVLDVKRNQLAIINSGHMGPIVRRAGNRIEIIDGDESGPPLGVVDDQTYGVITTPIDPGDVVVLYTDGVNEAMSPGGEMFGMKRLERCINSTAGGASAVGESIRDAVLAHTAGRDQFDDITLICFGRP